MATSIPKSMKDLTSLTFTDANGANELLLALESGDMTVNFPDTHEHVADRGGFGNLIDGVSQPITLTLTAQVQEFSGTANLLDVVTCTAGGTWDFSTMNTSSGDYSALDLTAGTETIAASAVGVFQMRAVFTDPGDGTSQTAYFANCRCQPNFTEGMPDTFTLNITSYMSVSAFMESITASA